MSTTTGSQACTAPLTTSPRPRGRGRLAARVLLGVPAVALGVLLVSPTAAQAHVEIGADTTAAGSVALLSLNVPHGCAGAATTAVVVRVPDGVVGVTPTVNPGWTISKKTTKLAEPVTDDDGETITTRVSEVTWRARTPLPDGYRDELSMQVLLPADAAGQQLAFPTIQNCGSTEVGWTQVPAQGQDEDELEHPAPMITVTAALSTDADDHQHSDEPAAAGTGTTDPAADSATAAGSASVSASPIAVGGLVLGALGLAAGGTALVLSLRRPPRI